MGGPTRRDAASRRDGSLTAGGRARPAGLGGCLALALVLGACGSERAPSPRIPDSVYVEVMARLVLVDSTLGSPADRRPGAPPADTLRARILEEWGVRGEQLLEFARTRGREPGQMEAVWQRIRDLSDSLESAGWRGPGGGADTTPGALPRGEGPAPPDTTPPDAPVPDRDSAGASRGGTVPSTDPAPGAAP